MREEFKKQHYSIFSDTLSETINRALEQKKKVVMMGDNILVKRVKAENVTKSGIFIPENSTSQPGGGMVIVESIPDEVTEELGVYPGDKVLVPFFIFNNRSNYSDLVEGGMFIKTQDMLAVVKD